MFTATVFALNSNFSALQPHHKKTCRAAAAALRISDFIHAEKNICQRRNCLDWLIVGKYPVHLIMRVPGRWCRRCRPPSFFSPTIMLAVRRPSRGCIEQTCRECMLWSSIDAPTIINSLIVQQHPSILVDNTYSEVGKACVITCSARR